MTTRRALRIGLLLGTLAAGTPANWAASPSSTDPAKARYTREVQPLLRQFCYGCHGATKRKADLSLEAYQDLDQLRKDRKVWERVLANLRRHEMPPEGRPQPSATERARLVHWIETELFPLDCAHPDPGRVTIRRLNRAEYNNTVRDLVGVNFQPAEDFPADDAGYGFDNIGDVLSMSPLLLEKYLAAAEKILDAAVVTDPARLPSARSRRGNEADSIASQSLPPPDVGGYGSWAASLPTSHRRIFFCHLDTAHGTDCARRILTAFAERAYRRPVTAAEVDRLVRLADAAARDGATFEASIKLSLQAVLVSPHFLFRGELQSEPDNPQAVHPVGEFALASRLSYFLWSSMPDDTLFALAHEGRLRRNLEDQVRRMLHDPKARALVDNFAGQWLQTRNLKLAAPDAKTFPDFDDGLRASMQRETELLFETILREDRSVLEFLTADYTFVDARLARHYGLPGVPGPGFQRVSLKGTARGGVLTHASVLTLTSNPTRTSPVKRGKWVLENLLGAAPPPPPPDVPALRESTEAAASGSLRQRMEQHRNDPNCVSCHAVMDPIGFGLENFDGIGAWRTHDGAFPVDPAGKLASGEAFAGPAALRDLLARQKRDAFVRCLTEKLLTYALGRGLEYSDTCAVDRITRGLARKRYRFSALVLEVVQSTPFQMRRGEGERLAPEAGQRP